MEESLKTEITSLISRWLNILEARIKASELLFKSLKIENRLEAIAMDNRNVYLQRSIENFHRISTFINKKIVNDSENAQMYLCQLRTTADILSRIIYILSQDVVTAARIVLCEDAVQTKKIEETVFLKHYESLVKENPIFSDILNFPSQKEFSYTKLKNLQAASKINLLMPSFEDRLDDDHIKAITFDITNKIKISLRDGLIKAHNNFSHHVHGNHLLKKEQGNEIFWLSSYCLILISCASEIWDREVLSKEKAADIRILSEETLKARIELLAAWKLRRKQA